MAARLVTITIVLTTADCSCVRGLMRRVGMYYDARACLYKGRLKTKTAIHTRIAAALYRFGTFEVSEMSLDPIDVIMKPMHACFTMCKFISFISRALYSPCFLGCLPILPHYIFCDLTTGLEVRA